MACDLLTAISLITLYRASFACAIMRGEDRLKPYISARKCTFVLLCIIYLLTIVIYTVLLATQASDESWVTLLRNWLLTIFTMILTLAIDLYFTSILQWALKERQYQEKRSEIEINDVESNQNASEAGKDLMGDNESQVSEIGQSHLPLQIDNPIELKSKRKMSQRKSVQKGKKRKSTLSKNNKLEGDFE